MQCIKIKSIEWIETGGNSCVRDIHCNHADISNTWKWELMTISFASGLFSNFWLHSEQAVVTLVMHPEPRIPDNTTHKDRLLRHKSHQVMTNRLSSPSPIVVLTFFCAVSTEQCRWARHFCTFLDWRYRMNYRSTVKYTQIVSRILSSSCKSKQNVARVSKFKRGSKFEKVSKTVKE